MQTQIYNSNRLDIAGSRRKSDQEIFHSTIKRWRGRLGYCSMVAAVPALLAANLPAPSSAETKDDKTTIPGSSARLSEDLQLTTSKRSLLKRQSQFRLPHLKDDLSYLPVTLAGVDDCPGATIPGGNYPAAAPYLIAGDTTGANDTVTSLNYYYYYTLDAAGPDHVYSFTLTGVGPNARIEVSTTSGSYKPLVYVLYVGPDGTCPVAPYQGYAAVAADSRWTSGNTAVLATYQLKYLPLNYPLRLMVDSAHNDASGAGAYTIRLEDLTIAPAAACSSVNPIDCVEAFARQQYLDFFGREPDTIGFQNWVNTVANCGNGGYGEFDNPQCDRVHLSASFVQSNEFQGRGYWLLRFGYVGLNRSIGSVRSSLNYGEFIPALQQIGGQNSPAQEEAAKVVYTNAFVQRPDFQALFPNSMSNSQYVNALESNAGVTLSNKVQLLSALDGGTMTRAEVLRNIVESQVVFDKYIIPSFVDMEYKGYLRRDPDTIGYQNWVNTLAGNPSDYRHMVFGFIYSAEYRGRFGQQ